MIAAAEVNAAYERLSHATDDLHRAAEYTIDCRIALEDARLRGMVEGTITGKNADEREASARLHLAQLFDDVVEAEHEERKAKLEFDLARLEVERVRALLRLAEISQGANA